MRAAAGTLLLSAVLLAAGCGNDNGGALCSVDLLIDGDVGVAEIVPCGSFTTGSDLYTEAAMSSAQLCVLNAIKRKQGFRLAYDANDQNNKPTPGLRAGWSGVLNGGRLVLRTYAGQGDADKPMSMDFGTTRGCDEIIATPDCKPTVGVPCLSCNGNDNGSIACRT